MRASKRENPQFYRSRITIMKKLRERAIAVPSYDPRALLDRMSEHLSTSSDYALAMALELPPPTISKIRNSHAPVTAGVLLRMHDVTKLPVDTLRSWMGVPAYAGPSNTPTVD
jgi:transcriptional regulator with XRE-family HTH domain